MVPEAYADLAEEYEEDPYSSPPDEAYGHLRKSG
ncbi:hypothetical protein JOE57_002244 [Microlunatus panaciterrae]|uniref:Uncharacterized protein n=1 Tax=Microlunatus panaciterrae TaxID=400768 RepID=A0ABS2RKY0_9ACTN|nr:hypothetical protein [Microlunatus panaciterrae]